MQIKLTLIKLIYSKYACNHHVVLFGIFIIYLIVCVVILQRRGSGGVCVHTYINFAFPRIDKK